MIPKSRGSAFLRGIYAGIFEKLPSYLLTHRRILRVLFFGEAGTLGVFLGSVTIMLFLSGFGIGVIDDDPLIWPWTPPRQPLLATSEDCNVDSDSNVDGTANIGSDGATDYTDAQTLDGTDQTIAEADQGGGGGPPIEDYVDNDTCDVDSVPDLGDLADFSYLTASNNNYANFSETSAAGEITVPETPVETFSATEQTSHTVTLPTYQANDVVVIVINHSPDGTAAIGSINSDPTGFTEAGTATATGAASDSLLSIWYKVMTGSEGSTVSVGTTTVMTIGAVACGFRGVDTTTPLDATVPAFSTGSHPISHGGITTQTEDAMLISAGIQDATSGAIDDTDVPTGFTVAGTMNNNPPSNGMNLGMAYDIQESIGASGTISWQTNTGTEEVVGATVALRAASGSSDYNMDQEVQFTGAIHWMDTEYLCIETGSFGDTENINVTLRSDSSTWVSVASDLTASTWNNYSININSSTVTIKFGGSTTTSDTTFDYWMIDCILIRTSGSGDNTTYVMTDTSDVDTDPDNGTLSDFSDCQSAPDSSYANLTESTTGTGGDWGITTTLDTETTGTWTRAMGGIMPATSGMTLDSVSVYCDVTHTAQIRLGVYQGGVSADDPSGADLIADVGQTAGTGTGQWFTLDASGESLAASTRTWIAFRETGGFGVRYAQSATGDFDATNGRYVSAVMATDPATSYEDPWPSDTGSRSAYWYAVFLNYSVPSDSYLDQEMQWSPIPVGVDNVNLSINTGTTDAEDLTVEVWNTTSSAWDEVFSDLTASSWNNISVADWVYTSTFTIRFTDEGGADGSPDSWYLDSVCLYFWAAGGANYYLEWEHQATSVPQGSDYYYNLTIYGHSTGGDSESFSIQMWNSSSSTWHTALSMQISTSETWYNETVSGTGIVGSTMTWIYNDTDRTSDTTQSTLNIDYAGIKAYNMSLTLTEATFTVTPDPPPDSVDYAIAENPFDITAASAMTFDIQIKGVDTSGTPVASGWVYFDTDSNPSGYTQLSASWQTLYQDQSPSEGVGLQFWLRVNIDPGQTYGADANFDVDVRIVQS